MLESLVNPRKTKPWELFLLSIVFAPISFLFSYFLFPEYSSVLGCAILTILFVPFFQHLFLDEEKKEEWAAKHRNRENLFRRHEHVLKYYGAFFLGTILVLSVMFYFIPENHRNLMFKKQVEEIQRISGMATGKVVSPLSGKIFINNSLVLLIAFISSLIFGTGAIFILSWNASVIATFSSLWARSLISKGMSPALAFLYGVPNALLAIALHGIPEITGYFFAGIAGGVLSVGLLREKIGTKEFKRIVFDGLAFLLIGEYCIFVAAFIETGATILSVFEFIMWAVTMSILFSTAIKI